MIQNNRSGNDERLRHWQKLVSFYIKKASKKYRSFQKKKSVAGAKIILTWGNLKSVAYLKLTFIFIPNLSKGKKINEKTTKIYGLPGFWDIFSDILRNILRDITRDILRNIQNQHQTDWILAFYLISCFFHNFPTYIRLEVFIIYHVCW